MADRGWNRRRLLAAGAGCGALFSAEGATGPARAVAALLGPSTSPAAAVPGSLADLLSSAPDARFWASSAAAKKPADCLACHEAGELAAGAEPLHSTPTVRCQLCARNCTIANGDRGACRARMNVEGRLKSLVYGRPVSIHVDPIEKKPFYHFLPGRAALSLSTTGCPLRCKFCQNWEISQARPEDFKPRYVPPREIVLAAERRQAPVIAFTYNEPTVFMEYLTDIARQGRKADRRSVLVSCGFMNEAPLTEMCQVLDAIKIDLKGFSEDFYRRVCGAELRPVLRSIAQVARSRPHLEIVNLVVPTLNDSPAMLTELAKWVAGELGPDVPIHFTRFHPDYQLPNLPPTPISTLERAREIALREGLHYPFVGNVPGHPGNHTYCPRCGQTVIERHGFFVKALRLDGGECTRCQHPIAGVWS